MKDWREEPLESLLLTDFDGVWGPESNDDKGVKVLRSTDMRGGHLDLSGAAVRQIGRQTVNKKRLSDGDILVNKSSGSAHLVGQAVLFVKKDDNDYLCSNFIRCLRPNIEKIHAELLYYSLQTPQFKDQVFGAQRTTSGLRNLKVSEYKAATIRYPDSIQEQRSIVARIKECMARVDEIEALRGETTQEQEALLESQIEALLGQERGEETSLGEVCGIGSKLVDPREPEFRDLIHVGGANIESRTGRLINLKTANEEGLKSAKFSFDESMVLYNKVRPYLVKVARPDFSGVCSADMYPLLPDETRLTRDYLFFLLMSRRFTRYAIDGSNRAGMPKVNRQHLFGYRFELPTLKRQVAVAQVLDAVVSATEELRLDLDEGTREIRALRESILRKAFAGEL